MTVSKIILFAVVLVSFAGCATQEIDSRSGVTQTSNNSRENKAPNQYGWDDSNCAHIMADGHCAHATGINPMENTTSPASTSSPNANGWNSSNCAHVTADGNCAHPL